MLSKEVTVNCIIDENVKWATYLVQTSNNYASSVRIKHNGYDMNAKSLLGVLSLKLSNGEEAEVVLVNRQAGSKPLLMTSSGKIIDMLKEKDIKISEMVK